MTSEQLFYDKKTGFDKLTGSDKRNMTAYAEEYKKFLNEAKTCLLYTSKGWMPAVCWWKTSPETQLRRSKTPAR